MDIKQAAKKAAELINNSHKTLVLTGAGISTESGIPDYRSKDTGLWGKYDPAAKASVTALMNDPVDFYNFNIPRWTEYTHCKPNIAHRVLAQMEKAGLIRGIITQNIDGLHIKAGSEMVWEVHGHLRTCHCMKCGESYDFTELTRQYNDGINPPRCENCDGLLRPDVVLFGDSMSRDYFQAQSELIDCQLLLVVGSSLQVYPVADMPYRAEKLIIVNKEPTPCDDRAEIVVNDSIGKFFTELAEALEL
jgi:NAD-dependent deacetylase